MVYQIAAISALGGLLFGFDTGVISGALQFMTRDFQLSTTHQAIVVSAVVLGAFFGAALSGRLADHFGRRNLLLCSALLFIFGTLLLVTATKLTALIVGRSVVGVAIGICSYATPLFISEMAPAANRGFLVLFNAIMITGGEALAYLSDYWLMDTGSWRWMFAVGLLPAVLLLLGMLRLPPTPRWLVLKGQLTRAKHVLKKLRDQADVDHEFSAIQQSFIERTRWPAFFKKPLRGLLFIGVGLGVLQQFVGINTVMYYGPTIFQQAGFNLAHTQMLATLLMGLINMVISMLAVFMVDRVGRRRMLNIGTVLATFSLTVVGLSFVCPLSQTGRAWVVLTALSVYMIGYCMGLGSMFWLVISEIYPLSVRGFAMSLAAAVQWLANFVVSMTFLAILNTFGPADTFGLYALMSAISFVFCYRWVPETGNISLEQIEKKLRQDAV